MEGTRRYALILAGVAIASLGSGLARPAIAYYARYTLGAALLAATAITSSFMFGRTVGSLLSGAAGARRSSARWLVASGGIAGASLFAAAAGSSGSVVELHFFVALWGLMAGLAWPTVQTGVADVSPGRSNTLLSLYFAVGTLGISIGNKLFGELEMGYGEMVRAGAALIGASIPFFAAALRGLPRRGIRTGRGAPGGVVGGLAWIVVVALAIGFLSGMMRDYFYIYAREAAGMSREELGNLLAAAGVLGVATSILAGVAADRVGAWRVLPLLVLLAAAGAFLLSAPGLAWAGYILAALSVRASLPQTRNAALLPGGAGMLLVGLSNSASSIGMMLGPIVAGLISPGAPSGAPYRVAGEVLLAAAALYVVGVLRGKSWGLAGGGEEE